MKQDRNALSWKQFFNFFPLSKKQTNLSFTQYYHPELDILQTYPVGSLKHLLGYPLLPHKFQLEMLNGQSIFNFCSLPFCLSRSTFISFPLISPLTHITPPKNVLPPSIVNYSTHLSFSILMTLHFSPQTLHTGFVFQTSFSSFDCCTFSIVLIFVIFLLYVIFFPS